MKLFLLVAVLATSNVYVIAANLEVYQDKNNEHVISEKVYTIGVMPEKLPHDIDELTRWANGYSEQVYYSVMPEKNEEGKNTSIYLNLGLGRKNETIK